MDSNEQQQTWRQRMADLENETRAQRYDAVTYLMKVHAMLAEAFEHLAENQAHFEDILHDALAALESGAGVTVQVDNKIIADAVSAQVAQALRAQLVGPSTRPWPIAQGGPPAPTADASTPA